MCGNLFFDFFFRFDIGGHRGWLNQLASAASCSLIHLKMPEMIMESFCLWHLDNFEFVLTGDKSFAREAVL
jgi:hypothetical protein